MRGDGEWRWRIGFGALVAAISGLIGAVAGVFSGDVVVGVAGAAAYCGWLMAILTSLRRAAWGEYGDRGRPPA